MKKIEIINKITKLDGTKKIDFLKTLNVKDLNKIWDNVFKKSLEEAPIAFETSFFKNEKYYQKWGVAYGVPSEKALKLIEKGVLKFIRNTSTSVSREFEKFTNWEKEFIYEGKKYNFIFEVEEKINENAHLNSKR